MLSTTITIKKIRSESMRIKIPIFMLVLLILSACNNQAEENYQQLLTSFERNDSSLNKAFEETTKNIEEDSNRDKALHDINDKLIPQIEDFQQTVKNYQLEDDEQIKVQNSMLSYLEENKKLLKMYSDLNSEFFMVNSLNDESMEDSVGKQLNEIKNQEERVSNL